MFRKALSLACLLSSVLIGTAFAEDDAETIIRNALETPFREQTGTGFDTFRCALPTNVEATGLVEFTCEATVQNNRRFEFRLWRDNQSGESQVTQWQPAKQLPAEEIDPLTETAERFLDAFAKGKWPDAAQLRHSTLASLQSEQDFGTMLAALSERVGKIKKRELHLYNAAAPGVHVLEYRLEASNGSLLARLQLTRQRDLGMRISGYLIEPELGTQLALSMLEEQADVALSDLLGAHVEHIEIDPFKLINAGDSTESLVKQKGGPNVAVLISRVGSRFDFDTDDYRFRIIDVPWMLAREEVQNGRGDSHVSCPKRFAAEGDGIDCQVTQPDGSIRRIRVERKDGEHHLIPLDPT